jgi:hypothetical protein
VFYEKDIRTRYTCAGVRTGGVQPRRADNGACDHRADNSACGHRADNSACGRRTQSNGCAHQPCHGYTVGCGTDG